MPRTPPPWTLRLLMPLLLAAPAGAWAAAPAPPTLAVTEAVAPAAALPFGAGYEQRLRAARAATSADPALLPPAVAPAVAADSAPRPAAGRNGGTGSGNGGSGGGRGGSGGGRGR